MAIRYDENTKARAVRLVREHRDDYDSEWAAMKAVSDRWGMSAETLRKWVRQSEIDAGEAAGVSSEEKRELRELRRKTRELEQTIEILKAATSFFAREYDPRHAICGFINAHPKSSGSYRSAEHWRCTACRSPRAPTDAPLGARRDGPCGTWRSPRSWPASTTRPPLRRPPESLYGASRCGRT